MVPLSAQRGRLKAPLTKDSTLTKAPNWQLSFSREPSVSRGPMATFFFDFCQDSTVAADEVGLSLQSAEEAFLEARQAAVAMWAELLRQRRDPRRCAFQVRDNEGSLVFILPFSELLEDCHGAGSRRHYANNFEELKRSALRARQLGQEFLHELNRAKDSLAEARRLIGAPGE
jgi:hypothetical protein